MIQPLSPSFMATDANILSQCRSLADVKQMRQSTGADIKREYTTIANRVRNKFSPLFSHSPFSRFAHFGHSSSSSDRKDAHVDEPFSFATMMEGLTSIVSGWMGRISLAISLFEGVRWGFRLFRRMRKVFT